MRAVAVALLPVVVALAGCGQQRNPIVNDVSEIHRLARITIPGSASNVHCAAEQGIDSAVYGRFDVPAADLPLVLGGMPVGEKVQPYDGYSNVTSHKKSEPWWQPGLLSKPKVANWTMPGFSVNLLFGEAGQAGVVTLYFFNFRM
jgi:hypothetical protein